MNLVDQVADRLRRADAELKGRRSGLLDWEQVQDAERERWRAFADAAAEAFAAAGGIVIYAHARDGRASKLLRRSSMTTLY